VGVIANRRETLAKMLLALIVSAVMLAGIAGTADAKELEARHGGQGGEVELEFELPG
jgi:hypothetical protein